MEQEVIGKIDDVPTSIHEGITSEFYEQIELVHSKGLIELAPVASLSLVFRRNWLNFRRSSKTKIGSGLTEDRLDSLVFLHFTGLEGSIMIGLLVLVLFWIRWHCGTEKLYWAHCNLNWSDNCAGAVIFVKPQLEVWLDIDMTHYHLAERLLHSGRALASWPWFSGFEFRRATGIFLILSFPS